jgi:hypothetical protein
LNLYTKKLLFIVSRTGVAGNKNPEPEWQERTTAAGNLSPELKKYPRLEHHGTNTCTGVNGYTVMENHGISTLY